jgi:hypothetical protein
MSIRVVRCVAGAWEASAFEAGSPAFTSFPSLIWAMYPKIGVVSTNVPAAGKAFAFSETTLNAAYYFGDAGLSWLGADPFRQHYAFGRHER